MNTRTNKTKRSYMIIWERIRANPDKGVPIDVVDAYVNRVKMAVRNEKYYDEVYRDIKRHEKKTGILFITRAKHPTETGLVRVTFLLREFDTTSQSDSYYLRKYPPDTDLVKQLGLEVMNPLMFGTQTQEHAPEPQGRIS